MTKADAMDNGATWHNRIVGYGESAPDQLLGNEFNFRGHPQHQQDVLTGTLNEIGWLQDVIVNKRTSELWPDRDRNVETMLDGHLRVMLAMRYHQPTIPIKYVDLTPDEERLALLTFDPISALAFSDAGKLDALLQQTKSDNDAVNKLLKDMAHDAGLERDELDVLEGSFSDYITPGTANLVQVVLVFEKEDAVYIRNEVKKEGIAATSKFAKRLIELLRSDNARSG